MIFDMKLINKRFDKVLINNFFLLKLKKLLLF